MVGTQHRISCRIPSYRGIVLSFPLLVHSFSARVYNALFAVAAEAVGKSGTSLAVCVSYRLADFFTAKLHTARRWEKYVTVRECSETVVKMQC